MEAPAQQPQRRRMRQRPGATASTAAVAMATIAAAATWQASAFTLTQPMRPHQLQPSRASAPLLPPCSGAVSSSGITSFNPGAVSRLVLSRHSMGVASDAELEAEGFTTDLHPDVETALYAAIREHGRIHAKQEHLEYILGRSASVAEWAGAAGYVDSMSMLAALRDGQKAQNRLVKSHRPMVAAIARRYAFITKSLTLDDLIQEGTLGLLSATDKFDPDRGSRFGTYAAVRVKAFVLRAIANKDRAIRIPVYIQDGAGRVRAATSRLTATLGRPPTDAEIAATLDMPPAAVAAHRAALDKQALTVPGLESDSDAEQAVTGDAAARTPEVMHDLMHVLETYLAPKEVEALALRFGLGGAAGEQLTFKEVGGAMQTSAEGIRRIVDRALRKLREGEAWRLLADYAEFA